MFAAVHRGGAFAVAFTALALAAGELPPEADASVKIPDALVTRAKQTNAHIKFIEDPALLANVGGVGALLRYRL